MNLRLDQLNLRVRVAFLFNSDQLQGTVCVVDCSRMWALHDLQLLTIAVAGAVAAVASVDSCFSDHALRGFGLGCINVATVYYSAQSRPIESAAGLHGAIATCGWMAAADLGR